MDLVLRDLARGLEWNAVCILLVEDEFLTRAVTQLLLEDLGHDVLAAQDGQQAFDYLNDFPGHFSCLVTDYQLAGAITGAHIIHRMRPIYPAIPILATASVDAVTPEWMVSNRVSLLAKLYDPEELAQMLEHDAPFFPRTLK